MAVMNLATLPRTVPTRFLQQECHATMANHTHGINTPITGWTGHTPIMAQDIGDISAGHSPVLIPTVTEAAVLKGTPCTLLPATTPVHASPSPWMLPLPLCCDSCTPSHTCHFSCWCHSHHSTDWSQSQSSSSCHATQGCQPKKVKQCPRPSIPHKPHCPKTITILDSPSDSSSDSDSNSDPSNY